MCLKIVKLEFGNKSATMLFPFPSKKNKNKNKKNHAINLFYRSVNLKGNHDIASLIRNLKHLQGFN